MRKISALSTLTTSRRGRSRPAIMSAFKKKIVTTQARCHGNLDGL
jgi:hypothetical protein